MTVALDLKIRQMHAALRDIATADLGTVRAETNSSETYSYTKIDFNAGADDIDLANAASLLIANIASIKDHLRAWCRKHNVHFRGEELINKTRAVALVHDLWNVDKHAELDRAPRSGYLPRLQGLRQALRLTTGTTAGSSAFVMMDTVTGSLATSLSPGSSAVISLVAQIVDENGSYLADFTTTCAEAARAWEAELAAAGVVLR